MNGLGRKEMRARIRGIFDAQDVVDAEFDKHCAQMHGGEDKAAEGCPDCRHFIEATARLEDDYFAAEKELDQ